MHTSDETLVISAYWEIPGNTKPTKGRHLKKGAEKRIDLFFSYQDHGLSGKGVGEYVHMPSPSPNLYAERFKTRRGPCFTHYSVPITWSSFGSLAPIWLGKLKLLAAARKRYPNKKYYMWGDLVHRRDEYAVMQANGKKAFFSFNNRPLQPPYGGLLSKHRGILAYKELPGIVTGQVLRIHTDLFDEFYEKFYTTLDKVNHNYFIYDEEIVLSEMLKAYPGIFERVRNPKGMPCFSS